MPHTPPPPQNRPRAKAMRKRMTDAELKFWNAVRAHRLMGMGFRRQVPIGPYIVDFACHAHNIVVEIDGSQHGDDDALRADAVRTRFLEESGWTILRFINADALRAIDDLCLHVITVAGLARPAAVQHEGARP